MQLQTWVASQSAPEKLTWLCKVFDDSANQLGNDHDWLSYADDNYCYWWFVDDYWRWERERYPISSIALGIIVIILCCCIVIGLCADGNNCYWWRIDGYWGLERERERYPSDGVSPVFEDFLYSLPLEVCLEVDRVSFVKKYNVNSVYFIGHRPLTVTGKLSFTSKKKGKNRFLFVLVL